MRCKIYVVLALLCAVNLNAQQLWNPLAVDVTRSVMKDLFESNAVPYIQPMVTTINATSNARFYDNAHVPTSVDRPYFKVSVNGMLGFIDESMRTYTPTLDFGPRIDVIETLGKYGRVSITPDGPRYIINDTYADTLGLTTSLVRELFRDGLDSGFIVLPDIAATLFGFLPDTRVLLPNQAQMTTLLQNRPEYRVLDAEAKASLDTLIGSLPLPEFLTLPPGVDMSSLIAAVPQLEVGSVFGTEALIRFIPPVEFDENVGEFAFWGFGLKHSLSQYFSDSTFNLAVQGVYQGTSLKNTVGFTESKLEADATRWSGNVHASKDFFGFITLYSGVNFESIDVTSSYTYVLPQEVQISLGLLPAPPLGEPAVPTPDQPGDDKPQTSIVEASDTNVKWTIGGTLFFGDLRLAFDYSVSRFNIFSAGLSYTF